MKVLITICARSKSKGVKDKNIKELAGKPLIAHTLDVANLWGKADRIICSTDSQKIAKIAKEHGAEVPFTRPDELSGDETGKMDVIRHALKECERIYNERYDLIIDLDVTNPVRTTEDLDKCLEIFKEKNPDLVFSVVEARRNPYFNMVELDYNGFAKVCKEPKKNVLRRQDAPRVYDVTACIYFYSREFLNNPENDSTLSSKRVAIHVMGEESAFDIDSELDFKFIESIMKNRVVK